MALTNGEPGNESETRPWVAASLLMNVGLRWRATAHRGTACVRWSGCGSPPTLPSCDGCIAPTASCCTPSGSVASADGEVRGHHGRVREGLDATYLHQCVSVEDSSSVATVAVLSDCALHLSDTKEGLFFFYSASLGLVDLAEHTVTAKSKDYCSIEALSLSRCHRPA